jgi:hypothetical protein
MITDYVKPISWTRDTNVSGYVSGTYDVLSTWKRGPDVEPMSNTGIYSHDQVEYILSVCGITEEMLCEALGKQKVEEPTKVLPVERMSKKKKIQMMLKYLKGEK